MRYITEAIEQEWVSTSGKMVNRFEQEIAAYVGMPGAVACQSGTAGLHLALMLAGVERGDEVIVPTLTFIAAVNPVKYVGAEPIFMDCDDSLCMDMSKLRTFCENECEFTGNQLINRHSGRVIKAVVVVHKIITTGGGGMLVSGDEGIMQQARYLSTQAKDDPLQFIHNEIGYNYRMTNLQAAVGIAQLEQLESFIEVKKRNYEIYKHELNGFKGISILDFRWGTRPNYWFYSLVLSDEQADRRLHIIQKLHGEGIQTRPLWGLIHEQKPYLGCQRYQIERARYYYERIINLPCSSNLSEEDIHRVIQAVKKTISGR